MNRRTLLRRMGVAAGTTGALGTGTVAGLRPGVTVDVSDAAGRVSLDAVVDDPAAVTTGLGGRDPADVSLLVSEEMETITGDVTGLACCCARNAGEDCFECDEETCRVIGVR